MSRIHYMDDQLAYSHEQEDKPWWMDVYREAFKFPGLVSAMSCRQDGEHQRAGIDRVLMLANSQVVYVDEKVRKEVWPDFALEVFSDFGRKTPGWVMKPLLAHFIAYAFAPTGECYLFPTLTLQRSWTQNGRDWYRRARDGACGYRFVDAYNDGPAGAWTTRSVAVPRAVVLDAVKDAMFFSFSPPTPQPKELT